MHRHLGTPMLSDSNWIQPLLADRWRHQQEKTLLVRFWHNPEASLPAEMRPKAVVPRDFLSVWQLGGA
ncbi:MAG: hypothetical protein AAGB13_07395 [Cyanobacteria bacterium P01_F01_bin.33]